MSNPRNAPEDAALTARCERSRRASSPGENRCWSCTVVNLALVVAAALAGTVLAPLGPAVLLLGGVSVYLRGYVGPGTPRFAPRLVAPLPFDIGQTTHETVASGSIADGTAAGVPADDDGSRSSDPDALIAALVDAGVLVADGDRLRLADAYREAFEARLSELRALSPPTLAVRAAAAATGDVSETTLQNCCGGPGTIHRNRHRPVLACEECATIVFEFDAA